MQRHKLLLDVTCIDHVEIHYQRKVPACPKHSDAVVWEPNANDLHLNHYKLPFHGAYRTGNKRIIKDPNTVEWDASLADAYRDKLLAEANRREQEEMHPKLGAKSSWLEVLTGSFETGLLFSTWGLVQFL